MSHQRPLEPKVEKKELTISIEEFLRTRDSVVTGLTTLIGLINDLNKAYLNHTNELLRGAGHGPIESFAITNFYQTAKSITAGISGDKPKRKRAKKDRDPNAPKRPLTAFFLYSTHARPLVKSDMGAEAAPVDINAEILRRWNSMPESEKNKWKQQYEINNEKYKIESAAYKAQQGVDVLPGHEDEEAASIEDVVAAAEDDDSDASDSSDSDDEDEEEAPPVRLPSPPKGKAKGKRKAKENETPIPLPSTEPPAASSDKRKRGKADDAADEPKKKKSRKADVKESAEPAAPASTEKKSKKHKRKD